MLHPFIVPSSWYRLLARRLISELTLLADIVLVYKYKV